MQKHTFPGDEQVAYLRFLTAFRKICDDNGVSEPETLKIWPNLLSGNAQGLFDHITGDTKSDVGGLIDFPNGVQFFLRTYAREKYLEEADERLVGMKQSRTESVQHYLNRLTEAARDLAGAY